MSSPSLVLVLAEDQRHKQFIYRFLVKAGIGRHQMRIEVSPSGQGSAEQWVRNNFARQVRKCRSRSAGASTGMFVLLDADNQSVREHMDELDAALVAEEQQGVDPKRDPVARLIPKWSIETWVLFLVSNGAFEPPLTEDKSYKELKTDEQWSELIPQASETLYVWSRSDVGRPQNLLDSLQSGLNEIPRALPAGR